jgi:hypothetical protein
MQQAINYERPKSRATRGIFWRVVLLGVVLAVGLTAFQYVSSPSILSILRTQVTTTGELVTQQRTLSFSPYVHTLFTHFQASFTGPIDTNPCQYTGRGKGLFCPSGTVFYRLAFTLPIGPYSPPGEHAPYYSDYLFFPPGKTPFRSISDQEMHALDRAFTVWDVPFLTL